MSTPNAAMISFGTVSLPSLIRCLGLSRTTVYGGGDSGQATSARGPARYSFAVALYEYRCPEGHRLEVFHRIDETPEVRCEVCRAPATRVLSAPMIHTQYYFSAQVHGAKRPRHRPAVDPRPSRG
jgi:putative FmdB family regulatory protein